MHKIQEQIADDLSVLDIEVVEDVQYVSVMMRRICRVYTVGFKKLEGGSLRYVSIYQSHTSDIMNHVLMSELVEEAEEHLRRKGRAVLDRGK